MKKKIWITIGVIALIGGFIGFNVWQEVSAEKRFTVKTTQLKDEEITATVMTPGTLKLKNEQSVYVSPEKGEVDEILVKEGDKVKKGDELLRYTNEEMQLEKEQNALNIESAYLRINNIKKQLERLKKKEKDLSEEIGEEDAKETIAAERDQLQMEERSANIELKQSQLQKESIEKRLKELKVKSEVKGTVLEVDEDAVHISSAQAEPKPVIRIAALDELIVEGVLSEYDTLKVKEDQPVTLRSDVVPDKEWKGKITHIGYLPEQNAAGLGAETEAVQYAVEVAVESDDIELKPGFQMIMDIETEKKTVPTLPLSAIVNQAHTTINIGLDAGTVDETSEDESVVYVVANGVAQMRTVEVGMVSGERIEIKSGLEPDEQVIVDPPDDIKDGAEVTVE